MTIMDTQSPTQLDRKQWVLLGLTAAVAATIAVLIVEAIAIAIWPDVALFLPLDNYARAIVFTTLGAAGATAVFAWLVAHKPQPVRTFTRVAIVVLIISFIPDYILPVPNRTLLASTVTATLHVVAAVVIVSVLVKGY